MENWRWSVGPPASQLGRSTAAKCSIWHVAHPFPPMLETLTGRQKEGESVSVAKLTCFRAKGRRHRPRDMVAGCLLVEGVTASNDDIVHVAVRKTDPGGTKVHGAAHAGMAHA